ncbi:MAG: hypothetical protein MR971_02850 [Bacteroidales bacterium]|nr:hypothetical protein [Bacteroidales bacterium]
MSVQLQRNSSLDLVRLIAFVLLITCHTCDPFNAAATYGVGESTRVQPVHAGSRQ